MKKCVDKGVQCRERVRPRGRVLDKVASRG